MAEERKDSNKNISKNPKKNLRGDAEKLSDRVLRAKNDNNEKEALIKEYLPLINKKTSEFKRKYFSLDVEDIRSNVLKAFLESIKKYKKTNGAFLGFFYTVSSSRIIDYYRKEIKYLNKTRSYESEDESSEYENETTRAANRNAKEVYKEEERSKDILKELYTLERSLEFIGLSLKDVAKSAPRHKESREKSYELLEKIMSEKMIKKEILENQIFDVDKISLVTKFSKPFVKKSEYFVVALMFIRTLGLELLDKYII